MAGIFDGLNGVVQGAQNAIGLGAQAPPTNHMVPLDAGSQGLLQAGVDSSKQTPAQYAGIINQGADQAASQFQAPRPAGEEAANKGSAVDAGYLQGLRNAYQSQAQGAIQLQKQQSHYQGEMMKAQRMQGYAEAALGQQNAVSNFNRMATESYMQNQAARAQLVDWLFQAAGTGLAYAKAGGKQSAAQEWAEAAGPTGSGALGAPPDTMGYAPGMAPPGPRG